MEIPPQLKDIDPTARLVLVHDELLIEVAEDKADAVLSLAESVMVEAGREIFGDASRWLLKAASVTPGGPLSNGETSQRVPQCPNCGRRQNRVF